MKTPKKSLLSYELELFKQMYDEENNYRNQFSDKVFKTITVIIALVGALIWLINNFLLKCAEQNYYIIFANISSLVICFVLSAAIIIYFFRILYGYKEVRQTPGNLYNLIEEYKSQTSNEKDIINAIMESLVLSYIDASIKTSEENDRRIKMFKSAYRYILVDIIFTAVTFIIELIWDTTIWHIFYHPSKGCLSTLYHG